MNVLQIVRKACGTIGITRPNSIVGSSDSGVIQLIELLDEEGSELAGRYPWQAITREATFTTVAQEDQGALTTIIGATNAFRYIVNDTFWNRSRKEPVKGPRTGPVWQGFKALSFTGPFSEYRIRGGRILMLPIPTAGETCAFEYMTKNWLTSSDGSEQRSMVTNDEDIPVLDDELILAGLKWRWRKTKGLDYSQDFDSYEMRVADAMARDGTKPRLSLAGHSADLGIPMAIPRTIGL